MLDFLSSYHMPRFTSTIFNKAFSTFHVRFTTGCATVSGLKDEKLIKSKPTWKLKQANSILESFEYFGQISSKLILTILR